MASNKKQKIYVDEKAFAHMYENLLYPWTFYILTNADFDKAIAFSNSRLSHKWSAEDYSVGLWFNPIKNEGKSSRAQAFDSPCLNRKYPKLLVFTRFPVLVLRY